MSNGAQMVRLPGRRHGVFRRASLWDAGDYLLSISGTTFSEKYRRFYYRDIKCVVVQQGPRLGSVGGLLLTILFGIPFMVTAFLSTTPLPVRWLVAVPVSWLAWSIYVDLARSCRVVVFTAVSSEELQALFRRRSTAQSLPKILSRIAEAQGSITGEQTTFAGLMAETSETPSLPASRQILYSVSLFSLLCLLSAAFAFWYRDAALTPGSLLLAKIFLPLLNTGEIAAGLWAIYKLLRVRLLNSLRICIFAGLALVALRTYALLTMISLLNQPDHFFSDAFTSSQVCYWIGTSDCALSLTVGLAGFICLMLMWQATEARSAESTP